jgi:hypothetical protein
MQYDRRASLGRRPEKKPDIDEGGGGLFGLRKKPAAAQTGAHAAETTDGVNEVSHPADEILAVSPGALSDTDPRPSN